MKAKDLTLRVVNEIEEGKFEIKEFKPYMTYESYVGCILGDAEILRPIGIKDIEGVMIYENYIVEVVDTDMLGNPIKYNCVIEYDNNTARFIARELRNDDIKCIRVFAILNRLCKLKILGNIYQNMDLINGG